MKAKYVEGIKGLSNHNLMFSIHYPMRYGKFPEEHPFSDNREMLTFRSNEELELDGVMGVDRLSKFRAAGYWASCFPEGDGITFKTLKDQSREQIISDLKEFLKVEL